MLSISFLSVPARLLLGIATKGTDKNVSTKIHKDVVCDSKMLKPPKRFSKREGLYELWFINSIYRYIVVMGNVK